MIAGKGDRVNPEACDQVQGRVTPEDCDRVQGTVIPGEGDRVQGEGWLEFPGKAFHTIIECILFIICETYSAKHVLTTPLLSVTSQVVQKYNEFMLEVDKGGVNCTSNRKWSNHIIVIIICRSLSSNKVAANDMTWS